MSKQRSIIVLSVLIFFSTLSYSESAVKTLKKSKDFDAMIPVEVLREIPLPKGYHEGLLIEKDNIFVNNGENGKTWIIDLSSGEVISEIDSPGTFSEGITKAPGNKYWITDWDTKKLYLTSLEKNQFIIEKEISFTPSHPTGVVWNGKNIYLIIWTRGIGTKYHLLKLDENGKILDKIRIKKIQEPSQITWDGKNLWISSWFQRRVYKIDPESLETKGYFRTEIKQTTGIAWDGEYFWVTGTHADLYKMKITEK